MCRFKSWNRRIWHILEGRTQFETFVNFIYIYIIYNKDNFLIIENLSMWSSYSTTILSSSINYQRLNFPSSSENTHINNDIEAKAVFAGTKVEETIISFSSSNQKCKRKLNK